MRRRRDWRDRADGDEGGSKEERWQIANGGARAKWSPERVVQRDIEARYERAEPTGRYRWCVGGNKEPIRKQEERTVRRQSGLWGGQVTEP